MNDNAQRRQAMALVEVKVPDIGDFEEVEVIEVLVKPGDTVAAEQSLITVESDKAVDGDSRPAHAGVVQRAGGQAGRQGQRRAACCCAWMRRAGAVRAAPAPAAAPCRRRPRAALLRRRARARRARRGCCTAPLRAPRPAPRQPGRLRASCRLPHASPSDAQVRTRTRRAPSSEVTGTGPKGRITQRGRAELRQAA
jgi:pyruvate dehydrogenase E2 component (dihydrolipoamide acetyltransferase)